MNLIPKSNARVEFDATERLTLRTAATLLSQLLNYYDKIADEGGKEIGIDDWKFCPDDDCFSVYELVEMLDDLGNDTLKIELW